MNILITGGAGFIGSNVAEHLLGKGHSVTILDNLSSKRTGDRQKQPRRHRTCHQSAP